MNIKKENVVIIIPTYNEALVIADTLHLIFQCTQGLEHFNVQVLIFDSASKDKTQAIIKALIPDYPNKLHLKSELKKTGLGSAYLQAMNYALETLNADIIFEFDADLSHQPKYISPILELLKNCDVVVGSRYVPSGSIPQNWGLHRRALSFLGNYVARLILTRKYRDLTSGFRATRAKTLKQVLPEKFLSNNYAYKLHLFWLLHCHNAKILEFPIEFIDRTKGKSKLPTNSISDSLRVIFTLRLRAVKAFLVK